MSEKQKRIAREKASKRDARAIEIAARANEIDERVRSRQVNKRESNA